MVSLLRQIVAGPRARHPEAGLDLCYVTDFLIATSGPSQTYPELAYRNPLDQLVAFLDAKHGRDWAVWEFRAEGTGYPDEAVYNRIWHYPWPDHHPPPFRLVPMMMASMRNWLHGDDRREGGAAAAASSSTGASVDVPTSTKTTRPAAKATSTEAADTADAANSTATESTNTVKSTRDEKRVVVVHCKAGKGRSGTASCSYLIAEEGWAAEDALRRFTERRMRPQFGPGISIPSQLRWVGYVDRWTRGGKRYRDRRIEVREIRAYGLRNGVRIEVEGFADEGKTIERVGVFGRDERVVEEPGAPDGGSLADIVWDLAGYPAVPDAAGAAEKTPPRDAMAKTDEGGGQKRDGMQDGGTGAGTGAEESVGMMLWRKGFGLIDKVAAQGEHARIDRLRARMQPDAAPQPAERGRDRAAGAAGAAGAAESDDPEPGGKTVVFRPSRPIVLRNSDINIAVERRNRSSRSMGLTVVTAVAHVWFNAFFEGNGPENGGRPDSEGVFAIDWEGMDGIKGSSRKGARALDRLAVAWRAVDVPPEEVEEIREPEEGEFVPQAKPADWHLDGREVPEEQALGVDDMEGVKTSGPAGGDIG
ncbi:Phosphatidylinositol 3 [Escovopsis weberi]|uniref:phosphatidylinositol-3,4,5-trisphosphate 3-phosphatase n=1 Tax=Escovopsis weberi TaxID=150374 RepID=A0A0M9VUX2_ESCWE|nr:Phosphatidylinositol 3 [Escovopsis weberi]